MKTKIAFFEVESWEENYFSQIFKKQNLLFFKKELNEKNIKEVEDFEIISIFINSKIDRKLIKKFKELKAIVTRSTGYNHIDVKLCKRKKISVLNAPFYGENTVAEYVFMLILALSRKLVETVERTKKRDFSIEGLRGFDLKRKTLGIIGMGNIGSCVAKIAKGFGMNILAYNKNRDSELSKKLKFKYTSLNFLLKNSDVITLHLPLTKKTYHFINKKNIKIVKKGAYLINTSRGEIVDNSALLFALNKKILAGVGLDVLEGEGIIKEERELFLKNNIREKNLLKVMEDNILLDFENVIITPHNAFNTKEALYRILEKSVKNINSVINKK